MGTYTPTYSGFVAWVFGSGMGVPTAYLASDDPVLQLCYDLSVTTVREAFQCLGMSSPIYQLMVYNLAGHYLAQFAQDPSPLPVPPGVTSPIIMPVSNPMPPIGVKES